MTTHSTTRVTGDGMMLHIVDTWTDKHGITRCDVWCPNDVRQPRTTVLLPVIPNGEWRYEMTHQQPRSLMATHRYVFDEDNDLPPVSALCDSECEHEEEGDWQ
jgi:hypothetical protein